jgi:hypothetical protein
LVPLSFIFPFVVGGRSPSPLAFLSEAPPALGGLFMAGGGIEAEVGVISIGSGGGIFDEESLEEVAVRIGIGLGMVVGDKRSFG